MVHSCGNSSRFTRDSLGLTRRESIRSVDRWNNERPAIRDEEERDPDNHFANAAVDLLKRPDYLGRMSDHTLRPVTTNDGDIAQIATLLREVFPTAKHFTEEALRWQYRDNPDGQVVGFNAWQGDELAAHYVTIPFKAKVNGKQEKGLLSLNTATRPAHQGKGLFTKLAKSTYELGAEQGFGFVIGVANANSTHGFTKKLGFQLVSPLRAMIGLGPLPFRENSREVHYEQDRSLDAFSWRLAHPCYAYSIAKGRHIDLVLSGREQFGCRYVLHAARNLRIMDGIPLTKTPMRKIWIGLDPAMDWRGSCYMNIPMRFRPSPLNLIFKDLSGQGRTLDAKRVRFHAMDFDIL